MNLAWFILSYMFQVTFRYSKVHNKCHAPYAAFFSTWQLFYPLSILRFSQQLNRTSSQCASDKSSVLSSKDFCSLYLLYFTLGKWLVKLYTSLCAHALPPPIIPMLNLTQNVFSEAVTPKKRVKDDSLNFQLFTKIHSKS